MGTNYYYREATCRDEYGQVMAKDDIVACITQREYPYRSRPLSQHELDLNCAVRGPSNLLRCKIDEMHCIGHGAGTWDLEVGEFS